MKRKLDKPDIQDIKGAIIANKILLEHNDELNLYAAEAFNVNHSKSRFDVLYSAATMNNYIINNIEIKGEIKIRTNESDKYFSSFIEIEKFNKLLKLTNRNESYPIFINIYSDNVLRIWDLSSLKEGEDYLLVKNVKRWNEAKQQYDYNDCYALYNDKAMLQIKDDKLSWIDKNNFWYKFKYDK